MEMMKNFGLLGAFDIAQKRALIAELKAEIKKDMESKKAYKASLKEEKAAASAFLYHFCNPQCGAGTR